MEKNRLPNKIQLIVLFMLINIVCFGQEHANRTYPIEFDWQHDIAKKKKRTIEDYFLLLPSQFLDCERIFKGFPTVDNRIEIIKKKDLRNGYLEFHGRSQIALFKDKTNSKDIIAIQIGGCGAGNTCGSLNTLLEFTDNKWVYRIDLLPNSKRVEDIYNEIEKDGKCPYFNLPQIGTTIELRDENNNGSIIMKYEWTGQRFNIIER